MSQLRNSWQSYIHPDSADGACVAGVPAATAWFSGNRARRTPRSGHAGRGEVLAQLQSDVKLEVLLPWHEGTRSSAEASKVSTEKQKTSTLPPLEVHDEMHTSQVPHSSPETDVQTEREALEQTMLPHYVLMNMEMNVLEDALVIARNETQEDAVVVHVEGKERRSSLIPDTRSHARVLATFTCKTISRAIGAGLIHLDQWKVLLESPLKSWYDPVISRFPAAVVHIRVLGLTKLKEKLSQGPQAAEKVGEKMNTLFDEILSVVHRYSGDVVQFTADSLVIMWASEDSAPESLEVREGDKLHPYSGIFTKIHSADSFSSTDEEGSDDENVDEIFPPEHCDARTATTAACRFSLHVLRELRELRQNSSHYSDIEIQLATGYGELALLQLGGLFGRWEYCFSGKVLEELAGLSFSLFGECICSAEAASHVDQAFTFEDASSCSFGYKRLVRSREDCLEKATIASPSWWLPEPVENVDLRLVKRFVPSAVALRVACAPEDPGTACGAAIQLEEMRRVSVVSFSIQNIIPHADRSSYHGLSDGRETQLLMRLLQRSVFALEGQVNKFIVDEQGIRFVIVFGLPPLIHYNDDPIRAAFCGMRLCDLLRDEGLPGKVGITTGHCWCGVVGNAFRREYVVVGEAVDLAISLMRQAPQSKVLVDAFTQRAAAQVLEFVEQLAGQKGPTSFFAPCFVLSRPRKGLARHHKEVAHSLIHWRAWPARVRLLQALEANSSASSVLFIRGPDGAGKTELAEIVRSWVHERGWTLLGGQSIDPSGIFALQRLALQEAFGELVQKAGDDPFWRSACLELLLSSLGDDDRKRDDIDIGQLGRQSQKNGPPSHAELYWMLIAMLRQSLGPDAANIEPWVPVLSLVVIQLAFGPRMVSAMVERDEQHARNHRFADLCTALLDAFSSHGSPTGGTVLLLHIRRCNAFRDQPDPQQVSVIRAISELCMRRRKNASRTGEMRPLFLCVVSNNEAHSDKVLVQSAKECNGIIEVDDFNLRETFSFIEYLMKPSSAQTALHPSRNGQSNPGTKTLYPSLCNGYGEICSLMDSNLRHVTLGTYLQHMTGGNPKSILRMFGTLEASKVVHKHASGFKELDLAYDNLETFQKHIVIPESLVGESFSFFERLDPMEQMVLKRLSACARDVVPLQEIVEGLPLAYRNDIEKICDRLARHSARALKRVISDGSPDSCEGYRFYSGLLRHAVSTLVLRSAGRRSTKLVDLSDLPQPSRRSRG